MNYARLIAASLTGIALLGALPAQADVRTGVDAWTRGDYAAAIREWQPLADKGDADALFNLAQAYKLGRGVRQDLARAEDLFGKAAAQGHIQASDNYGLLLFQRGQRAQALPYVTAAADRGDPRAQYLLGISHFNGDNVPKDWVRAYALVSLAQQSGLEQARIALAQMDQYVPLDQRQQAAALATELSSQAEATRARQLAAVDLGASVPPVTPRTTTPLRNATPPPAVAATQPPISAAREVVADAQRVAQGETPRTAGADYARPVEARPTVARQVHTPPATPASAPVPRSTTPAPTAAPTHAAPPAPWIIPAPRPEAAPSVISAPRTIAAAPAGAWRVQLGAFGVPANADALWQRVRNRSELTGHRRIDVRAGRVVKLQAGGFASQSAAQSACNRLASAGLACIVTRD